MGISVNHVDWEALEFDYRSGTLSNAQLARLHCISDDTVVNRAKEFGWERNLTDQISAAKDHKLNLKTTIAETENNHPTEAEIVETVGELQSRIILSHRTDIGLARRVCMKLLSELSALTDNTEDIRVLGDVMREPDKYGNDKQNDIYQKVISMKGRTEDMKRLADAITKLIEIEAKAYNIKDYREEKPVIIDSYARQQREDDYAAMRLKMAGVLNKSSGHH